MLVSITKEPRIEYHGEDEARLHIGGKVEITEKPFQGAYRVNLQESSPPIIRDGETIELGGQFNPFTQEFEIQDLQVIEDY